MDSKPEDISSQLARLGELVRSVGTGKIPRSVDALGEHRVAEAFAKARKGSTRGRLAGLGVVMAMMTAAVVISSLRHSGTALSWTVDGSATHDSKYISPSADKEVTVRFPDGSEFAVQPGSRFRIAEASRETVKAVLEAGASRVRISGRTSARWKIDVGPFSVSPSAVANLMVEWMADELLRVKIFEGETTLEGTPSPLHLHAGQQVSANARDGTVEVGPLTMTPEHAQVSSSELPKEVADPALAERAPTPEMARALPAPLSINRPSWSDQVAAGDYAGVLLDAQRRGIASVLAEASLADLVALADAARLSGRIDLAKRALMAERGRFPRTRAAENAAFFLGRIADDHERAPATALRWYEIYLSEAPDGHFATESFGRKMVAVSKQSGRPAAKEVAVRYLRRFPNGPHASLARELMNE